jgi:hypothetical protein
VRCFFSLKAKNLIPRNRDRQRSTKIAVEGKIFAFGFTKKYDISLLSIECQVLDRCPAFDRLVSVDAHLWSVPSLRCVVPVGGEGGADPFPKMWGASCGRSDPSLICLVLAVED